MNIENLKKAYNYAFKKIVEEAEELKERKSKNKSKILFILNFIILILVLILPIQPLWLGCLLSIIFGFLSGWSFTGWMLK